MIFLQNAFGVMAYILSRSYASWFFSVPLAFGIVYLIFNLLWFWGARK